MSDFLRRMVLNVQKPGGSIRPMAGSVFVPPSSAGRERKKLPLEPLLSGAESKVVPPDFSQPVPPASRDNDAPRPQPSPEPLLPQNSGATPEPPVIPPSMTQPVQNAAFPPSVPSEKSTLKPLPGVTIPATEPHPVPNPPPSDGDQPRRKPADTQKPDNAILPEQGTLSVRPNFAMGHDISSVETVKPTISAQTLPRPSTAKPQSAFDSLSRDNSTTIKQSSPGVTSGANRTPVPDLFRPAPETVKLSFRPLFAAARGPQSMNATDGGEVHPVVAVTPRPVSLTQNEKERYRPRRSEPEQRQSEDIQIHIGRIEVVAARPPRPAAPKTRRGISSLDEYLRRRDGKAV